MEHTQIGREEITPCQKDKQPIIAYAKRMFILSALHTKFS